MRRVVWTCLFALACGDGGGGSQLPGAEVRIVVEVPGSADGRIEVSRLLPDDSAEEPFRLKRVRPNEAVEAELPGGRYTLVAVGELDPHPSCAHGDEWPHYEGMVEVFVSVDPPPPVDGIIHVIPLGEVEEIRIPLEFRCN